MAIAWTGRIPAKKGLEYRFEFMLLNPGPLVFYTNAKLVAAPAGRYANATAIRRKANGVAEHIFYRAMQQFRVGTQFVHFAGNVVNLYMTCPGLKTGVFDHAGEKVGHVDRFRRVHHACFQPGQRQQLADQLVHSLALALDTLQTVVHPDRLLARQANGSLQPGKWRTQFMGNVVEQALLAFDHALQSLGHVIEIPTEIGQFVAAPLHAWRNSGLQVAVSHALEAAAQLANRTSKIPGQTSRADYAGQQPSDRWKNRDVHAGWPLGPIAGRSITPFPEMRRLSESTGQPRISKFARRWWRRAPIRIWRVAVRWRLLLAAIHAHLEIFPLGPEQHPGAEHRRHLAKPDEQEKFPEETPHTIP